MQDLERDTCNISESTPSPVPFPVIDAPERVMVSHLKKIYNGVTVLDIPSIRISDGESFGLVGNNGAGKTTFFRLILDLIEASSGEVRIDGQKVARNDQWKQEVGSFLDEGFLIDFLTPDEYFRSEEHTSELQSRPHLVCRLLLEKKKKQ